MVTWVTRSSVLALPSQARACLLGPWASGFWGAGEHLIFMTPHDTVPAPTGFPRFVGVLILTLTPDVVATSSDGPREQRCFSDRLHPWASPSQARAEEQRVELPAALATHRPVSCFEVVRSFDSQLSRKKQLSTK